MKPEDYTVLQGWMYGLKLTDKQRIAYAIIWGYSRDGRSVCRTTAKQLAEWLDCKERNAKYIIRQLEDMGLIQHQVVAVPKRRGHAPGVMTDFWAILPDAAARPEKKDRIDWVGRGKVVQRIALPGSATDCPTSNNDIKVFKDISGGGGKKSARVRAKTTTTTGFLFENIDNESGLTPGNPELLQLPFTEPYFVAAWTNLVKQPKWRTKTPEALQLVLDRFALTNDPVLSAFCCNKAIEREWATIKDPSAVGLEDQDQLMDFADVCMEKYATAPVAAQEEGAASC